MSDLDKADQLGADLIHDCYSKLGTLAAIIRNSSDGVRVVCPDNQWEALALMLYAAADECALRVPAKNRDTRH